MAEFYNKWLKYLVMENRLSYMYGKKHELSVLKVNLCFYVRRLQVLVVWVNRSIFNKTVKVYSVA